MARGSTGSFFPPLIDCIIVAYKDIISFEIGLFPSLCLMVWVLYVHEGYDKFIFRIFFPFCSSEPKLDEDNVSIRSSNSYIYLI